VKIPQNRLKAALARGQMQHGLWLNTASPLLAELAGQVGFDWCLIDGEHGPGGSMEVLAQLQALSATPASAVLRVAAAEVWMIKQALDLGVQTIVVPMVHDGETAAHMAAAMRYPNEGIRGMGAGLARASGFGAVSDYVDTANAQVCLLVQAESAAAVDNIDAIAATPGVDGVFVGPADLSADMGYPGRPDHPDVEKAIAHLIARTVAAGKTAGIISFDTARFGAYRDMGVRFLGVGGDVVVLRGALKDLLAGARQ
jgi:4-hydroxy-2-oxoheptanedioate aldolase